MLFFLLPSLSLAYKLTDCISTDDTFKASKVNVVSSVADCENICLDRNNTFFLLSPSNCFCYKTTRIGSGWTSRSRADCGLKCEDGLTCGGRKRFSLYTVDKNTVDKNTTLNQDTAVLFGGGDGQDVERTARNIAITVGSILSIAIVGILIYCLRRKKQQKLPQIEEDAESSIAFLIKDLLPVAPTGLYSVVTAFNARKEDEISLDVDQVVAIKEAYSDKWARGTNVTTGAQGYFPLNCLVSDEKFLHQVEKMGFEIPPRKRSAKASSKTKQIS
jgi:hypothetical protein